MTTPSPGPGSFTALRRFVRPRPRAGRCELCARELAPEHPHLLEMGRRQVVCSCDACAVLFSGAERARYRRIPQRVLYLSNFRLGDEEWDALGIPIGLAFFVEHSATGKVTALYPSPAGATEALLPLDAWPSLVEQNPVLRELEPDVEALLVNRIGEHRDHFLAPIDECFRLVGLIRSNWRGNSGGSAVWDEVEHFFASLKERSSAGG